MGGEKPRREDDPDPQLQSAFKRLKVDPQWSPDHLDRCTNNLKDFWCSSGSRSNKQASPKSVKASTKKLQSTRRREPYPLDFLNSIEKLTFHSEPCHLQKCMCSDSHHASKCKKFNYASSSLHHRPLIREARFRIHHSEKDCKQVIRAAKLKIHFQHGKRLTDKTKKVSVTEDNLLGSSSHHSHDSRDASQSTVFGAESKSNMQDFKALSNMGNEEKQSDSKEDKNVFCFKGYRSPVELCDTAKATDLSQAACAAPRVTSDCGVELSCSQQARLDDMSVNELAGYFDDFVYIPKKMSSMAEMMYI